MCLDVKSPSYKGLRPASPAATTSARASSRKSDTKPELLLRRALWAAGHRYRKNVGDLPGSPDMVFLRARLAVFCDGDFWHGRDWPTRRAKLAHGHNAAYWTAKIERNMARDEQVNAALEALGWRVLRFWEGEIKKEADRVVKRIEVELQLPVRRDGA